MKKPPAEDRFTYLGPAIGDLRRRRRLSEEQLAAAVGVPVGRIAEWEKGAKRPSLGQLGRLAAALRLDLGELGDALAFARFRAGEGRRSDRRRALEARLRRPGFDRLAYQALDETQARLVAKHPEEEVLVASIRRLLETLVDHAMGKHDHLVDKPKPKRATRAGRKGEGSEPA
jgi:transcriptional regulator with XRE-family HTH domain